MCIKQFLGCIPSKTGCLILAYVGIASSAAVLIYSAIQLRGALDEFSEAARTGNYSLEYEAGEEHLTKDEEESAFALGMAWIVLVTISYFLVHGVFIIFSVLLAIGAHTNQRCLVKTFFVYGFFHFFFMLFLASLHYYMDEYVETTLTVAADVLFAFCLFGVKGFVDRVSSGQIYSQPAPLNTQVACKGSP